MMMMMITSVVVIVTAVIIIVINIYLWHLHQYWKRHGVVSDPPSWIFGSLYAVIVSGKRQIGRHLGDLYRKYRAVPYFGIYVFGKPYLVLRDPKIIKDILIKDFTQFSDRSFACDVHADKMAANSLFIVRNPRWRQLRGRLSAIFTSGKIRQMTAMMNDSAMTIVDTIVTGEIIDMKSISNRYLTDLVAKCFFGIEISDRFHEECLKMFDLTATRCLSLFSYFFYPTLVSIFKLQLLNTDYLQSVFEQTLNRREFDGKIHDFVDLLLECQRNDSNFDRSTMVAQAITFFTAGFETTSNLIAFTLYELSRNVNCQMKLLEEIDRIHDEEITMETIQKLTYLDMCVAETLRRYPFGPFLNRICQNDYVIKSTGLSVKQGTVILIPLDGLHFDEEFYVNPDEFIPERFESVENRRRMLSDCVYMPFGVGPRNCIGDRFGQIAAKIGIIRILKQFSVESTGGSMELEPRSPFMTPINGIPLKVTKRV